LKLFEYQDESLSKIFDFYDHGGRRLLLQMPTGTGKSLVACEFIKRQKEQSRPIYFITHSKSLLWQFSDHLNEFGLRHGIIAPASPTLRYRIQVISAQSLIRRIEDIDEPWGLIFEEAHHSTTGMFSTILQKWPNARLLGLTATPYRLSGEPLSMYEHMIVNKSVRWFIDNYYLSDFDYFIPAEVDTAGIHHIAGDFNQKELSEKLQTDKTRVGNLVQYYEKYSPGSPGIAFGTSIIDSENIAERFLQSGYPMTPLHSQITGSVKNILNDCRAGKINLISTCDLVGEGVDVKGLSVEIDGRPTESLTVKLQHSGRVLRAQYAPGYDLSTKEGRRAAMEAGGKGRAKILDFSSNYTRHGLPDDEREWSLKGIKRIKMESKLKRCPQCQRPVMNLLSTCPYCLYIFPQTIQSESEETKEREGELIPISEFKPEDKNGLIIKIAREAKTYKQAVKLAKSSGAKASAAWYIWTKVLAKNIS
jgi:DNA repair protein RadD